MKISKSRTFVEIQEEKQQQQQQQNQRANIFPLLKNCASAQLCIWFHSMQSQGG